MSDSYSDPQQQADRETAAATASADVETVVAAAKAEAFGFA